MRLGSKHKPETVRLYSLTRRGKPSPKKGKPTGKPSWNSGKRGVSEETSRKMSESHRGIRQSEESKEKKRKAMLAMGFKHTEEAKRRISEKQKGSNHWNWKGGTRTANKVVRQSREYKLWRTAVFERDNYTCVWCGARSGNGKRVVFNADHIKPFALFPELRFAIDNGRTLCEPCHKTTDTYGGRLNKRHD